MQRALAPWLTVKDDPTAEPVAKQTIQRQVSDEERTRLIAAGQAVEADFERARAAYLCELRLRDDRAAAANRGNADCLGQVVDASDLVVAWH
jgi:hypothetical protein